MKNCKDPNNGGNVLVSKEGKLILMDQSANEISSVDFPDTSTKLDVSTAKAEYAHSLLLDGTTLKLMNHKDSPEVLSSVELNQSYYAHTKVLVDNGYISQVFEQRGILIEMQQSGEQNQISFVIRPINDEKMVLSTIKPIFYQFEYETIYQTFIPAVEYSSQQSAGSLITPDSGESVTVTRTIDVMGFSGGKIIIDVWAQLEPVE